MKDYTISIQGYEGCFHQVAARLFFGDGVKVLPCATFSDLIEKASNRMLSNGGMMAIENSIAGSILPNYTLLEESGLSIIGEVYLPIQQHLLSMPNVSLADIKEVRSHPMALLQCNTYLKGHRWKLVETEDTALSAKQLRDFRAKHTAAIAGSLAAKLYGLKILVENIHNEKENYTRFLAIRPKSIENYVEGADKATVYFQVPHKRGSLSKVLALITDCGINLSKLQSMPIAGSRFRYAFHVDMEFEELEQFEEVIRCLQESTVKLKVLGIYKNGFQQLTGQYPQTPL